MGQALAEGLAVEEDSELGSEAQTILPRPSARENWSRSGVRTIALNERLRSIRVDRASGSHADGAVRTRRNNFGGGQGGHSH